MPMRYSEGVIFDRRNLMSRNIKSWNKIVLDIYCDKPIAFIPSLARMGGGATAGLFISQMLYWCGKGRDAEWVYKTIEDMEKETCLSRSEQDRAIRVWCELGVLQKELRGVPPKRYFRVDTDKLFKLLDIANHIAVPDELSGSNEQNTITESSSENTLQRPVARQATSVLSEDRFRSLVGQVNRIYSRIENGSADISDEVIDDFVEKSLQRINAEHSHV